MRQFSIFNFQFSIYRGFTLIELLVAVGLFSALATIIISVLFVSFRTSKKSDAIVLLKQSGNAVLAQMVNKIRFARSLDDPLICTADVTQKSITITAFDGGQTVYSCPSAVGEAISSNSAALVDVKSVTVDPASCSFTCSQITTNDPPTIKIEFSLFPTTTTDFAAGSTSIPFQTTITMRNYGR